MKNNWKLSVTGCLTALLLVTSYAFTQPGDQKKKRHIKMTKIENGKKMEIDTVLTGDNVFVWNGDTINPEKHIKRFSPSEFDKLHAPGMDKRQKDVRIYRHRGGRNGEPFIMHADSGETLQIITHDGDTTGQKIYIHKMLRNGHEKDHFIHLHGPQGRHTIDIPHAPGVPHVRMLRKTKSFKGINLNDPNVISYKKKDISGGREKIEIIRKKTNESEEMDFDIEMDHVMDVPEPPMPPELDMEMEEVDRENRIKEEIETETKEVEKKTKGNDSKENK